MFSLKFNLISISVAILSVIIYLKVTPNIPDPSKGVLYYYQCGNYEDRVLLNSSEAPPIAKEEPFFLLIPGYTESSFRPWIRVVTKALLEARPSACVLVADYWNYLTFSRPFMTINVATIAHNIADLLVFLQEKGNLRFSNVHVIGFSMGGWVSGMIRNYLPHGKKVGRITGIDSSLPWTETSDPNQFLDSEDADIVVLIRTSKISKRIPPVSFDFCVNGGEVQPECDIWWHPDFVQQICSHYKAPFMFASHLLEEKSSFRACRCPNRETLLEGSCRCDVKNSFGLNTITSLKGKFYLETQEEEMTTKENTL